MSAMELRLERRYTSTGREGTVEVLQFRLKDRWFEGSTVNTNSWVWGEWKDVPVVEGRG